MKNKKSRALYICGNLIPCYSGDAIYTFGIIERVSKYFSLDVLAYNEKSFVQDESYAKLTKISNKLEFIKYNPSRKENYKKIFLFKNEIQKYTKEFNEKISEIVLNDCYDVIFIDHLRMFFVYDTISKIIDRKKTKIVLIEHNIEFHNVKEETEKINSKILKFKAFIKNFGLESFEKKAINSVDYVWAISEKDMNFIKEYRKDKSSVKVVSPYFEYENVKSLEEIKSTNYNLLFLGSMFWYPNVHGVLWFIENVFNKLIKLDKRYKLFIVGNNPTDEIKKYNSNNIIVTGTVKSVDQYIKNSDILIVPNFFGGGVKIKILEGIMKGIPIIATKESIEGYPSEIFKDGFCIDNEDKLVEQIININNDPNVKIKFVNEAKKMLLDYSDITDAISMLISGREY